jgi:hypothetical protein
VKLRDGSRVRLRQGRSSDKELLVRGFARVSPESRYRRFLTPMHELSEAMVRYLTEIAALAHNLGRWTTQIGLPDRPLGVRYHEIATRPVLGALNEHE